MLLRGCKSSISRLVFKHSTYSLGVTFIGQAMVSFHLFSKNQLERGTEDIGTGRTCHTFPVQSRWQILNEQPQFLHSSIATVTTRTKVGQKRFNILSDPSPNLLVFALLLYCKSGACLNICTFKILLVYVSLQYLNYWDH